MTEKDSVICKLDYCIFRVSTFADNGLGVNLRLTALISKLASYPQPLLKSVLLHPDVVVQPSCTTLFQAICKWLFKP